MIKISSVIALKNSMCLIFRLITKMYNSTLTTLGTASLLHKQLQLNYSLNNIFLNNILNKYILTNILKDGILISLRFLDRIIKNSLKGLSSLVGLMTVSSGEPDLPGAFYY